MTIAAAIIVIVKAYLLTGLAVAIPFLAFGIDRTDPSARGAYGFRPLIFPGLVLLWPLVALRWAGAWAKRPDGNRRAQRRAHLLMWLALAVVLSAALTVAWNQRQVVLPVPPSQRLSSTSGSEIRLADTLSAKAITGMLERAS
jgi:hypothetical protein